MQMYYICKMYILRLKLYMSNFTSLKAVCLAYGLLSVLLADAKVEHLLPAPHQIMCSSSNGGFVLNGAVSLNDPTNCALLSDFIGSNCEISGDGRAVNVEIVTFIDNAFNHNVAGYPDEAYCIDVSHEYINIKALNKTGVIRATQTLMQLAQGYEGVPEIDPVSITDWPAFKVRGFMHDVGRSFIDVDELEREIDLLSRFKVNTFHWHLTDYTGWRLYINAYPGLVGEKGITRYPGKYYTHDDVRRLQEFAAERGMMIIPEIDMPGHSRPFHNVMGHAMTTVAGKAELKVILSEVAELFDGSPYIHIGGDEISFNDDFLIEMIEYVHSLGKKVVTWNQYNSGPAKTVDPYIIKADMTTNWATSGVLSPGIPNIDMRYNYTNHFDVFADLVGIYKSKIFGVDRGTDDVGGTISAAWNDTKTKAQNDIVRQNNIYANILASATRAWIGGGEQYIEQGGVTLPNSGRVYDDFADWERRFLFHKSTTLAPAVALNQIPYVKQANVRWYITDQIPNGGNASAKLAPEDYMDEDIMPTSFIIDGNNYGTRMATGAGIYLRHIWHGIVKGFYDNPQTGMTAYAWTNIYSPEDQDAAAYIEFYTYSRSGNDVAPPSGKWDRRGSRIWLNGEEIPAPVWEQPDADIIQDQDTTGLTNENFTARPPVSIHLKQGWNRVFMKLPYADNGGTGRDKWQFTFVVTDVSGTDAIDGLIYSPSGKGMSDYK